ncbi:MAG TPA: alpha/beta hydrolase [Mycobacteriales bacterium]|nr:alpha/beta hydrolase [Mycobacteriales bacterium]
MTTRPDVDVIGDRGTPILVLPGGAATSRNFLPGVARELPDNRIVLYDRPGTGRNVAAGPATLASGSAAYAEVLRDLAIGPAVVVGQSLGGALAVQLAADHPDLIAGLVLIDPTPFNDATVCLLARRMFGVLAAPGRLPLIGDSLDRGVWRLLTMRSHLAEGEAVRTSQKALVASASIVTTRRALDTLVTDGAALTARLRPLGVPCVLITADRPASHAVRRAHDEMARAIGARVESWPNAVHAEQLRRPDLVYEVIREVAG